MAALWFSPSQLHEQKSRQVNFQLRPRVKPPISKETARVGLINTISALSTQLPFVK